MKTQLFLFALLFTLITLQSCFEKENPKPIPLSGGTNEFVVTGNIFNNTLVQIDTNSKPIDPDKSIMYTQGHYMDFKGDGVYDSLYLSLFGRTGLGGNYEYVNIYVYAVPVELGTQALSGNFQIVIYFYNPNDKTIESYYSISGTAIVHKIVFGKPFETDIDFSGTFVNQMDQSKTLQITDGNITIKY